MSKQYQDILTEEFQGLEKTGFQVDFAMPVVFLCGGRIDVKDKDSGFLSLRDRIYTCTAEQNDNLHDHFLLAETFKDYLSESVYSDLLIFEEDIANISSLIVILLESPGALVELGLFCSKSTLYKKLLIIAPSEETKEEDSFIYLGPLEYIESHREGSVFHYPWPLLGCQKYAHTESIIGDIKSKLDENDKTEAFNPKNSGHVAFLICDIIVISYPIIITEIKHVLSVIGIEVKKSQIVRSLYLLKKMFLIDYERYSNTKYYYPISSNLKRMQLTTAGSRGKFIYSNVRMRIRQSYINDKAELARKRRSVLKIIQDRAEDL